MHHAGGIIPPYEKTQPIACIKHRITAAFLELVTGFEPTTRGLRYRCSAVEPHQLFYRTILHPFALFFNKKAEKRQKAIYCFVIKIVENYVENL